MKKAGLALALTAIVACGGASRDGGGAAFPDERLPDVRVERGRPPVVVVARSGDPAGALAVAISTDGLVGSTLQGAEPPVALAGVFEARLAERRIAARVVPQSDGIRLVTLVTDAPDAETKAAALREVLSTPIRADEREGALAKLRALANRPLPDAALERWARCEGSPYGRVSGARPVEATALSELEGLRSAAIGLGRVVVGVAGPRDLDEAVVRTVTGGPRWPEAREGSSATPPGKGLDTLLYERGSGEHVLVHGTIARPTGTAAIALTDALGDPTGPLGARLAALDVPFRLRSLTGTAQRTGGCIGFVLESMNRVTETSDLTRSVADAIAVVHDEAEARRTPARGRDGRSLAWRAADPRDAAERAAWWTLTADRHGVSQGRQAPDDDPIAVASLAVGVPASSTANRSSTRDAATQLARRVSDRLATWKSSALEGRTRVEAGQGETWVLVASPCGTLGERSAESGISALVAHATREGARPSQDTTIEPWIASDGVGLLVHAPPRPGESPETTARRLADVAAEAFLTLPLDPRALLRARASATTQTVGAASAMATLAEVLAPGHPSSIFPSGQSETVARAADATVIARAEALRRGPLRVAVLANSDARQATSAVRAAGRWVDRRDAGPRACPAAPATASPRPGTYAVEALPGAPTEAFIAFPFPASHGGSRDATLAGAEVVGALLDGPEGLLASSVGGLAASVGVRLLGKGIAPALVIHVTGTDTSLDAAVQKVRSVLEGLRTAPRAELFERARVRSAASTLEAALDPRARLVRVFRGQTVPDAASSVSLAGTTEEARAFVRDYVTQGSMVIVAARPRRSRP